MRKQSRPAASPHAFDDVHAMVVFARVVQERSFTRAARRLGTSTSAVSKRVTRLEQRANARLLARTTRQVVPTEAGLALYERCLRILREVEDADLLVEGLSSGPRGLVRISAPVYFGELYVAPLLAALLRCESELRIQLVLEDRFVDLVGEGFDFAVRIGRAPGGSLIGRRIGRTPTVVLASPDYLARRGRPLAPADLLEHDCLRYTLASDAHQWRFRGENGHDILIPITGGFECNHSGALRQAVQAGLGIAYLPRFYAAEALERGDLVTLLDSYCNTELNIVAVYPGGPRQLPPKTRACIDWLAHELPARLATGAMAVR